MVRKMPPEPPSLISILTLAPIETLTLLLSDCAALDVIESKFVQSPPEFSFFKKDPPPKVFYGQRKSGKMSKAASCFRQKELKHGVELRLMLDSVPALPFNPFLVRIF